MMRRGTTPTIQFDIPFESSEISSAWITFSQGNTTPPAEVFTKTLEDEGVEIVDTVFDGGVNGSTIEIVLSQEDTLKFAKTGAPKVQAQIRILFTDGTADASNIVGFPVGLILKEGVIM